MPAGTTPLPQRAWGRVRRSWQTLWLIGVTGAASAAAWTLAGSAGLTAQVTATIAAVLTVQVSLHWSFRGGASMAVATLAGLLLAYGLYRTTGIHGWSVPLVVVSALVVGRALRLGPEGSLQVPATSLFVFVMGERLTDALILDRIAATVLGVGVGMAFSLVAHPRQPKDRASTELARLSTDIATVLRRLSAGLAVGYTREDAAAWLRSSRALETRLDRARTAVDAAEGQARWSLVSSTADAADLTARLSVLTLAVGQVRGIARTLYDGMVDGAPVPPESLARLLSGTAEAFAAHAEALGDDRATGTVVQQALARVRDDQVDALTSVRNADDTQVWLLSGPILSDVDRMVDQLCEGAPAVGRTGPSRRTIIPAVKEVVPAVREVIPHPRAEARLQPTARP